MTLTLTLMQVVWSAAQYTVSLGSKIIVTAGLLLVTQAVYVVLTTPRLPPPDRSGHEFEKEGLLASYYRDDDDDTNQNKRTGESTSRVEEDVQQGPCDSDSSDEFRLVLVGDSPVQGIGNRYHAEALGGQTALQFSKMLRRPVRYWSYGKSGLTAQGIQEHMVPHLRSLLSRNNNNNNTNTDTNTDVDVDAIVVSCGVNNTLRGVSPDAFGRQVHALLCSIRQCCPTAPLLVMELLDFELLPFIPYPLRYVASWRSRALRDQMQLVVDNFPQTQQSRAAETGTGPVVAPIGTAYMPRIGELLGKRHECSLLQHLTYEERQSLRLEDFFADDNFHPANIGTTIVGIILVQTYNTMISPRQ